MIIKARFSTLCALGLSALAMGCDGSSVQDSTGSAGSQHGSGANPNLSLPSYQYRPDGTGINNNVTAVGTTDLTVDYSLALRTAAIKLRGDLPTMAEIKRLSAASQGQPQRWQRERPLVRLPRHRKELHQRLAAL
jgi:hypothetical protein